MSRRAITPSVIFVCSVRNWATGPVVVVEVSSMPVFTSTTWVSMRSVSPTATKLPESIFEMPSLFAASISERPSRVMRKSRNSLA
jgi:hypothetical protein